MPDCLAHTTVHFNCTASSADPVPFNPTITKATLGRKDSTQLQLEYLRCYSPLNAILGLVR